MDCPIEFASEAKLVGNAVQIFCHLPRVIFQRSFALSPHTIIRSVSSEFLVHVFIWGLVSVSHGYFPQVSADPRLSVYI